MKDWRWLRIGLVVGAAIGVGAAIALWPYAALVPIAAILVAFVFFRPLVRLPAVVLGGLATLSSTSDITITKFAYLALVAVALCGALVNVTRRNSDNANVLARPVLWWSGALLAVIVASTLITLAMGTPPGVCLRDAASYILFASVPLFALDWLSDSSSNQRTLFLVAVGSLAALSYSVAWIERRHLAELPITQIVDPSALLACSLVAFASSRALLGNRHRIWWAAIAATITALLILSASRTLLLVVLAPVAIILFNLRHVASRPLRVLGFVVLAGAVCVGAVYGALSLGLVDSVTVIGRLQSIFGLLGSSAADITYQGRLIESQEAWQAFLSRPFIGVGPGYLFTIHQPGTPVIYDTAIDSGMAFVAKFGALGLVALGALGVSYISLAKRLHKSPRHRVDSSALVGLFAVAIPWLLIGNPFDDKGLSFGLAILVASALSGNSGPPDLVEIARLDGKVQRYEL